MNLYFAPYVKEEYKTNIRNYKYSGNDFSLIYKYIVSPLCNKIVEKIPPTIA